MPKRVKFDLKEVQDEARKRNIEPVTALYGLMNDTLKYAKGRKK